MDTRPIRRRSMAVTLGVTLVFAAALSGCSASQQQSSSQEEFSSQQDCEDGVSRGGFGNDCDDSVGG